MAFSSENEMKVSKETSVLFGIQIQHPPDRRWLAQFHNRAEDDTSFAAQQLRGGHNLLPQLVKEFNYGTG